MTKKLPPEIEEIANQIGKFIEYWGFKKVHGQIWTLLFLNKSGLNANALIHHLGISKALVSMSLKDLIEYDVIFESGKGERGTLLYKSNPNITEVILNVLRKRERLMLSQLSAASNLTLSLQDSEKEKHQISEDRLKSLDQMIKTANESLDAFLNLSEIDFAMLKEFQQCDY